MGMGEQVVAGQLQVGGGVVLAGGGTVLDGGVLDMGGTLRVCSNKAGSAIHPQARACYSLSCFVHSRLARGGHPFRQAPRRLEQM